MSLGDYFEYTESLPQITITSSLWNTIFSYTTATVPPGTYLICFNYVYQNSLFDTGFVSFRYRVDGSIVENGAPYLESDPGPGVLDSRETTVAFFQVTFGTETSHTIEIQGRVSGSPASYTRDIRMVFYEEDTTRANWAYFEAVNFQDQGTASTTWQDLISVPIVSPPDGANHLIWVKSNYASAKFSLFPFKRSIQFRVRIDSTTITEFADTIYNTSQDNDRANCFGKNFNCFFIDEGAHTITLQARADSSGVNQVHWNNQAIRVLRNL